ncbi:NTF2-like protein [Sistotremastrum niveocremeum HHB9708]|uniref:NTF2-like protein n=1 Tax=Sistotremastrum niveocremeum HHB9708 TaxID=1314777 RepID=A0A164VK76_9AGAM|nr:NTF2-like protein [Sistotremastrum niveocremeum HHB9708]
MAERDAHMKDATGNPGGRKATSKLKSHRRGTGIDIYKSDSGPARTSLAARIGSLLDPSGSEIDRSARQRAALHARPRRNAVSGGERDPPHSPGGAVSDWKEFVQSRYNAGLQFLNLENMAQDEVLKKHKLSFRGNREGAVILKLASQLTPEVKTISLANNGLSTLQSFSLLNHYLPNLANLSLQNNRLSSFKDLDRIAGRLNKGSLLRELVLLDNPLRDGEGRSLANYKSEIKRRFPALEVLDQEPVLKITFDVPSHASSSRDPKAVHVGPATFAMDMRPNVIDPEPIVTTFLLRFFAAFDADRSSLRPAYAPNATFSVSANTAIPIRARIEGLHTSPDYPNQTKLTWSGWLPNHRNLARYRDDSRSFVSLHTSGDDIISNFQKLPSTKHDLSKPENICLDAWPVPNMLPDNGAVLFITLHGQFAEEPTQGVRSFDRSFVLAAAPDGSPAKLAGWDVIILSDHLTVRAFSGSKAWAPSPLKVKDEAKALDLLAEPQQALVRQLSAQTKLNHAFAIQCLAENSWDFGRALANFSEVKDRLGPDAFL